MPNVAVKQAFLLLVACCWCWAMPLNKASQDVVPGVERPNRHLREAHLSEVAPVLLSEQININPVQELVAGYKDPDDKKLMGMINQFRAQICAQMKDENGNKFETYDKCLKFMNKVCRPGNDQVMDGDGKEKTSGKGYCTEFFPEAEKKARAKKAEEDTKAEEEKKKKEGEGGVDSVSDAIGVEGTSDAKDGKTGDTDGAGAGAASGGKAGGGVASAAAQGAAGAAGAPAGGALAGAPGGAPAPAYPKDEAWYYKDGGKNAKSRLGHMDGGRGLPKHGFVGKLVGPHKDGKSSVTDWQKEVGCDSDYDECWKQACAKHPDSLRCASTTPTSTKHHSGSLVSSRLTVFVLGVMATVGLF